MNNKDTKVKKTGKFWRIYLIAVAVMVLLGIIVVSVLWGALSKYENSEQEKEESIAAAAAESERVWLASDEYKALRDAAQDEVSPLSQTGKLIDSIKTNGYYELLVRSEFERSSFESDGGLADFLTKTYPPDTLVLTEISAETDEYRVISAASGETTLFDIKFIKSGEDKTYGFALWSEADVVFYRTGTIKLSITAPKNAEIKVSGTLLGEAEKTDEYRDGEFDVMPAGIDAPELCVYTLDGLAYLPPIAVVYNGEVLSGTIDENNNIAFGFPALEKLDDTVYERALEITKSYTYYISGDKTFADIAGCLIKGTPAYTTLEQLDNRWFYTHSGIEFRDLAFSNIISYNDNILTFTVSFTEVLLRGTSEAKIIAVKQKMYLMKLGDIWYLTDFILY